jgi:hypothetical protein
LKKILTKKLEKKQNKMNEDKILEKNTQGWWNLKINIKIISNKINKN